MSNVTVFCFLASYAVALGLDATRLLRLTAVSRTFVLIATAAGLIAHTAYLVVRSQQTNLPPLLASSQDWLLVLAWLAIVFYLFLTSVDRDLAIGLFLLPLVLALIGAAYFVSDSTSGLMPRDPDVVRNAVYYWAMLHASLLVLGIAGVLIGLVFSLMYLVQHYRLKHHQTLQRGLRLPNLERLARLNWWAVMVSVPLLTLGFATGVGLGLFSKEAARQVHFTDPVVIVSGVAWVGMVVFAVWLLRKERPAGKQVAWLTVWAFGFLLVTLVGLQVLTNGGRVSVETWHAEVKSQKSKVKSQKFREGTLPRGSRSGEVLI
jgi:ABC-type transport system involved in cytochrome c biogenesis permease subunit